MSYTFTALTSGPSPAGGVAASTDGSIIAAIGGGYIHVSTDSGVTFTTKLNDTTRSWQYITVSANGTKMAACADAGDIWVSTDSGSNWTAKPVPSYSPSNWRSVKYTRDGSRLFAGNTYVHSSSDDGNTWTVIDPTNYGQSADGIAVTDDGLKVVVTRYNNNVYIGTYSGSWSWSVSTTVSNLNPPNMAMSGDGTKIAVCRNPGALEYSTDGGSTWGSTLGTEQPTGIAISQDGSRFTAISNAVKGLHTTTNPAGSWTYSSTALAGFFGGGQPLTSGTSTSTIVFTRQSGGLIIANFSEPPVICFREGSKILTFNPATGREEYTVVENVRPGTLVKTRMSGYVPVCMVGTSTVTIPNHAERTAERLYVCSKAQFPELTEDLYITGHHSILVNSLTDAEREECAEEMGRVYVTEGKYRLPAHIDRRAQVYEAPGAVERIWHFALDHNDEQMNYGVYANGLLVESCSIWRLRTMVGYTILDSRSQVYIVGDENSGAGYTSGHLENTAVPTPIVC